MSFSAAVAPARDERCPICRAATLPVLNLRFNRKMALPTEASIRCCGNDNFLFFAAGTQPAYDQYYAAFVSDSCHGEVSGSKVRSPISELQKDNLVTALGGFFGTRRNVLDFGCGGAGLLVEIASEFPSSSFAGFDPGPAAEEGRSKAVALGLNNLVITDLGGCTVGAPYDLVIASHVVEHVIDFDLLQLLSSLLAESGFLYVEVPNSLKYDSHGRREFMYYFDRLHVNHFTPEALAMLAARYGLDYVSHLEYAFPYRDGGHYPALGMLFRKRSGGTVISSPSLLEATTRYLSQEKERAKRIAGQFAAFDGALVWGAGDNFFRSTENGGPLSGLRNMIVLDRRQQEITVAGRTLTTQDPCEAIRRHPWPVVVTVSEGRNALKEQIFQIDKNRPVFFV